MRLGSLYIAYDQGLTRCLEHRRAHFHSSRIHCVGVIVQASVNERKMEYKWDTAIHD